MRILVFGKNKKPRSAPGKVTKSLAIETYPISDLASMVPSLQDGTLVYLDLEGLGGPQREKVLTMIPDNPHLLFGVVDPTGFVADVAALFHVGAVDYIGRKMRGNRLNARRVSQVLSFADGAGVLEDEGDGRDERDGAPSSLQLPRPGAEGALSDGWSRIVPGKEYQFAILFVEVDGAEEMKKKHEPENLAGAMESFRSFVERMATQHGGRTWMWSQFGGLVLFPVKNAAGASLCGLRLFLSRIFYDVEESILPGPHLVPHGPFHGDHRVSRAGHRGDHFGKPERCLPPREALHPAGAILPHRWGHGDGPAEAQGAVRPRWHLRGQKDLPSQSAQAFVRMIEIWTDGGCHGNPGPGAWAFVIREGATVVERSGFDPETTNNRMELTAVQEALREVVVHEEWKGQAIAISTDSQYVQKGITEWIRVWTQNSWRTSAKKPVKNVDLWSSLAELSRNLPITWSWVMGHAGNEMNERCHSLVEQSIERGLMF